MIYRLMTENDIQSVIPLYIEYYNGKEDAEWTEQTTEKRIRQILLKPDSYCLIAENKHDIIAFAIGYFEQYDDCFAYDLVEVVVKTNLQNQGIGSGFMNEIEKRVKEKGAMLIQLQAVNDKHHNHFYKKLGYKNCSNLVLKSKIL